MLSVPLHSHAPGEAARDASLVSGTPPSRAWSLPADPFSPSPRYLRRLHRLYGSVRLPAASEQLRSSLAARSRRLSTAGNCRISHVPIQAFRTRTGLRPRRSVTVSHNDGAHVAFIADDQLGLREFIHYVAQSQSSHDLCLRFRRCVTTSPARLDTSLSATTLAGGDSHPLVCISFSWRTIR